MSACLRSSMQKLTLQSVRTLRRSSMGDNMRFNAFDLGLNRYPHVALTSVRFKSNKKSIKEVGNDKMIGTGNDKMRDISTNGKKKDVSELLEPIDIKPHVNPHGVDVGRELTGNDLPKGLS